MDCFVGLLSPTVINVLVQFWKAVGRQRKFSHLYLYSCLLAYLLTYALNLIWIPGRWRLLPIQHSFGLSSAIQLFGGLALSFPLRVPSRFLACESSCRFLLGLVNSSPLSSPDLALSRLGADSDWPPDFDESLTAVSKYQDLLNHFSFHSDFQNCTFNKSNLNIVFNLWPVLNTHHQGKMLLFKESS